MKMGCKFEGKCEFKKAQKAARQGLSSFHIYCTMDDGELCNQQTTDPTKCDPPWVVTKTP